MGRNFVKKEDVIKLLETISDEDGYVEKGKLLVRIRKLDIYTESEEEQYVSNSKSLRSIYNRHYTIQNINRYCNDIKAGKRKSSICIYLEKWLGVSIKEKELTVYPTDENIFGKYNILKPAYERYLKEPAFVNADIVISLKEVGEILKISKGTLDNWKKRGIINAYETHIAVFIDGKAYPYKNRNTWFQYYDLEEIKTNSRIL